jgi:hypothetical protein
MFESADRALWEEHLARVEQRIAHTEKTIGRQKSDIEKLELANLETRSARQLLTEFEQLLHLQIADRNRLREELGTVEPRQRHDS